MDFSCAIWGSFYVKDLFTISTGALVPKSYLKRGNVPRITATDLNNGISQFISEVDHPNYREFSNFISISFLGGVFYHPYKASLDMKIHALQPINFKLNRHIATFLVLCLKRLSSNASYGNQLSSKDLPKKKVLIPVDLNGQPDLAYMEKYMADLEVEKINTYISYAKKRLPILTAHLQSGIFEKKQWAEFYISDVAKIVSGHDIYQAERKVGDIPYISASAQNNGISYFISNINETLESNCLSVNRNGSVGYSFYHRYSALYSNDCRKLRPYHQSEFVGKFLSVVITAQKEKYGYGYKMGTQRLNKQKILLPTDSNSSPDFDYMENFMKHIEYFKLMKYLRIKLVN